MGTPHRPRASAAADAREEVDFLDQSLPVLDDEEMEDLYRHFLLDEMPEEDDGDEDFEPPVVDEDEEGEEAGVRRRNIQARELNDLVQDAYKQLGTSSVSPGLRERVLDQLSMHFQLLVQTGVLASKAPSTYRDQETACVGMLEHLACGSGKHARRTRARGKATSIWWDLGGEDLTSVGIPGLLPCRTLRNGFTEAGRLCQARGDLKAAVERLMNSRGAVIWPQLLPNEMVILGGAWPHHQESRRGAPLATEATDGAEALSSPGEGGGGGGAAVTSSASTVFSMVEDRLLCRGIHLYGEEWDEIRTNLLPHKPAETLMRRYAVLSGWATAVHGPPPKTERASPQGGTAVPWTQEEDLELRSAVQNHGKKWAHIAREVMPKRGRESLRNRWSVLEERLAVRTSSKGPPNMGIRASDGGGCPPTTSSLMSAADRRARERREDGKHAGSSQVQPTGAQQGAGGAKTPFGVHPLSVMRALSLWPPYAAAGNPGQLAALSGQFAAAAAAAAAAVGAVPKAPVTFPSVASGNRPDNPAFGRSAGVLVQPAAEITARLPAAAAVAAAAAAAAAAERGQAGCAATAAAAATRPRGQQARKRRMLASSHPDGQWASGAYQAEAVPPGGEDEDEARHRSSAVANGSSENRIGSLPARGETRTGAALGVPDRAAYAEDELSDDPDGSNNSDVEVVNRGAAASGCVQAVNDRHEEEGGAAASSISSRITREAPRYEEDELSDDDEDDSGSL